MAIRNAELNVQREKVILKEQQRQILQDLAAAVVDVNRAYEAMKTIANIRIAALGEYEPKLKRVEAGQDQIFFLLNSQQQLASAESNVFRAIKEYNQALMNYAYTTGSLLSRYNIVLTEAPWTAEAYEQARINAERILIRSPLNGQVDTCPVSRGPYDQQMPGPSELSSTLGGTQPYGEFSPDEILPGDSIDKGNENKSDEIDSPDLNGQLNQQLPERSDGNFENVPDQKSLSLFRRFRKN